MGTRGAYGFFKDGMSKITYNHWDSYPTGLGYNVCEAIKKYTNQELNDAFNRIQLIGERDKPTKAQVDQCKKFTSLEVGTGSIDDWYCLLRETQFSLKAWVESKLPFMIDNEEFMGDSLMCEWAYVINLDNNLVEFYQGFQKGSSENRYTKHIRVKDNAFVDSESGEPYAYGEVALKWSMSFESIRKMEWLELKDNLIMMERRTDDE